MQIQASKVFLSYGPLQKQQFNKYIPAQSLKLSSESNIDNCSINAYKLYQVLQFPIPLISILFAYVSTQDSKGLQFQMEIELIVKGQKIVYKLIEEVKHQMYLYKLLEIDSCVCYQKPITCLIGIKSCQPEPTPINYDLSVQQISQLLSTRSLNLQNTKTVCTYRRQLIVKQPLLIYSRYESKGYFWVKVHNCCSKIVQKGVKSIIRENQGNKQREHKYNIKIYCAKLKNWCVGGYNFEQQTSNPYEDEIKKYRSLSSFDNLFRDGVKLKNDQQVSFILSINQNLHKIEVPFVIQFCLESCQNYRFRMIKNLCIQ